MASPGVAQILWTLTANVDAIAWLGPSPNHSDIHPINIANPYYRDPHIFSDEVRYDWIPREGSNTSGRSRCLSVHLLGLVSSLGS